MCKIALFLVSALTVVGCANVPSENRIVAEHVSASAANTPEVASYAVYDAVLTKLIAEHPDVVFVVESRTSNKYAGTQEFLSKSFPMGTPDAINDFLAKNKASSDVKALFKRQVLLVTDEEQKEVFKGANGWDEFREKYPKSGGIIQFSNVGLNREMTQALVYVGYQRHWLDGIGRYAFLMKEGGAWKVKGEVNIWLS